MEINSKMKNISIIRGAFLNPFELQNVVPLKNKFDFRVISSKFPIGTKVGLPLIKLWSPTDLPSFPYKYSLLNRAFIDAHYLLGLEKVIAGADICHAAETYFHFTIQAIMAKRKGLVKKVVSTCWEILPHNNEGIWGRKSFKHVAYEEVDHFICPTRLARKALVVEGVNPKKISVVRIGVDLKRFRPITRSPNKIIRVLFVGRLVKEKGVLLLLKSFSEIINEGIKVKLIMVGSGPLAEEATNIGAVVKKIPYHQIHREYQRADIFCLPSQNTKTWQEQYGMALVEAMASGLPIVTSRNGAIPEVCSNAALYINSDSDLSDHIKKLILDSRLRKKYSQASLHRAKTHFDAKDISQKLEKIYLTLLNT
jgi:glycosyltransferase involved in cell wall biosynthesis